MEMLRVGKSVRRIIKIDKDASGNSTGIEIYKAKGKKRKKGSIGLRSVDKVFRRLANAQRSFADSYVTRHKRSNKKKDGWAIDLPRNVARASRTGAKKLRLSRLPLMP